MTAAGAACFKAPATSLTAGAVPWLPASPRPEPSSVSASRDILAQVLALSDALLEAAVNSRDPCPLHPPGSLSGLRAVRALASTEGECCSFFHLLRAAENASIIYFDIFIFRCEPKKE